MDQTEWSKLSSDEKKRQLFLQQKETLDLFLERHAITKAQYDKSLGDLIVKMGISPLMSEDEKKRRLSQREAEYLMLADDE